MEKQMLRSIFDRTKIKELTKKKAAKKWLRSLEKDGRFDMIRRRRFLGEITFVVLRLLLPPASRPPMKIQIEIEKKKAKISLEATARGSKFDWPAEPGGEKLA